MRDGAPGSGHSLNFLSSSSLDSRDRVEENRRQFLAALNLENSKLATLRQIHSNRVRIIKNNSEWNEAEGDALATVADAAIALGVRVADCLPILIADPSKRAIAAVHSGWRGTLSGILTNTILELQGAFACSPADLIVAVGPGIRNCCFEVGAEVAELFANKYPTIEPAQAIPNRPGKYLLDLVGILDIQMDSAGVRPENRYDLGACTFCNPGKFYSYRAQGALSGRMMAAIGWNRNSIVHLQS